MFKTYDKMSNLIYPSLRQYRAYLLSAIFITILYLGVLTLVSNRYVLNQQFNFVETHPDIHFTHRPPCKENFLSIVVTSSIDNVERRRVIRQTWARDRPVRFLLGQPVNAIQQTAIDEEAIKYGDIVQGDFVDSYRNLTYKSVMGLMYASDMCKSSFTYKIDDDTYVHVDRLEDYIKKSPKDIQCKVQKNSIVVRYSGSKWFVNHKEYPGPIYPDYCWGGFGAILSSQAIRILLNQLPLADFFWIEDVFITGILRDISQLVLSDMPAQHLALNMSYFQSMAKKNRSMVFMGPAELKVDEFKQVRNILENDK